MKSHAQIENHGRNQTVDAPSVHQQNARQKTLVHAHDANNHTMDATGTCHPEKNAMKCMYMETHCER